MKPKKHSEELLRWRNYLPAPDYQQFIGSWCRRRLRHGAVAGAERPADRAPPRPRLLLPPVQRRDQRIQISSPSSCRRPRHRLSGRFLRRIPTLENSHQAKTQQLKVDVPA